MTSLDLDVRPKLYGRSALRRDRAKRATYAAESRSLVANSRFLRAGWFQAFQFTLDPTAGKPTRWHGISGAARPPTGPSPP